MEKNYYEILRVRSNATQNQIKKSFLELVSKYHPDVYKGDKEYAENYTAILTEAYSVLRNPDKRQDYDISHNIDTTPSMRQLRKEDKAIRKAKEFEKDMEGKNYEQEMSRQHFRNAKQKKNVRVSGRFFKRLFKSKLFYSLLFLFAIEMLVILFIYLK